MDRPDLGQNRTLSLPNGGLEPGVLLLGKYRVDRILGRGGMGCVAAVRNEDLGELFAIKVLLPEIAGRVGAVERFVREARAAARLKTPHVVRVYDVGKLDDGAPYMLMEYLEGKDLGTLLEDRGVLSPRQVVDFVLEALDAICEAHTLGIIHRDLKPSNLFVTPGRDRRPLLKVLDFGISKELNPRDQATTQSGGLMGSPYYMSPEHMRSAKRVDVRTDLWSLGVIMFELLSGTLPFDGDTPTEVCSAVLEQPLPSLALRAPTTPPALISIVERCLQRSADARYASGKELADALKQVSDELTEAPRSLLSSGSWLQARVSSPSILRDSDPATSSVRPSMPSLGGPRVWGEDMPTMPPPGETDPPISAPPSVPKAATASTRAPSLEPWGTSAPPVARRTHWWVGGLVLLAVAGTVIAWSTTRTREPAGSGTLAASSIERAAEPPSAPRAADPPRDPEIVASPAAQAPSASVTPSASSSTTTRSSARPMAPSTTAPPTPTPQKPAPPATTDPAPGLKRPKF